MGADIPAGVSRNVEVGESLCGWMGVLVEVRPCNGANEAGCVLYAAKGRIVLSRLQALFIKDCNSRFSPSINWSLKWLFVHSGKVEFEEVEGWTSTRNAGSQG